MAPRENTHTYSGARLLAAHGESRTAGRHHFRNYAHPYARGRRLCAAGNPCECSVLHAQTRKETRCSRDPARRRCSLPFGRQSGHAIPRYPAARQKLRRKTRRGGGDGDLCGIIVKMRSVDSTARQLLRGVLPFAVGMASALD